MIFLAINKKETEIKLQIGFAEFILNYCSGLDSPCTSQIADGLLPATCIISTKYDYI